MFPEKTGCRAGWQAACPRARSGSGDSAAGLLESDAEIADVTTVAYLGPAGTYTEEAAMLFFGDNDELLAQETVADSLALVEDGTAAYAVIPQENTLGGPVTDYVDALLAARGLSVVGEGAGPTVVAIAAPGAAELYGLEVLQPNVSQSEANKTRFYVVCLTPNSLEGYDRLTLVADIPASELPALLDELCKDGTELVCMHDRPEGSALGTYRYVIELAREGGFPSEEIERIQEIPQVGSLGAYRSIEG